MLLDNTEYWTLCMLLCCGLESSQGVRSGCESCVKNVTISALPNSQAILPCAFPVHLPDSVTGGDRVEVVWTQSTSGILLEISKTDSVNFNFNFHDPREGRVKVFPNSCTVGNFSIRIDQLRRSDLGEYCCVVPNGSVCSVVEFRTDYAGAQNVVVQNVVVRFMGDNWYFICAGGVLLILLIACVCYVKYRKIEDSAPDHVNTSTFNEESEDSAPDYVNTSFNEGSCAGEIVYENDDQVPKGAACVDSKPQQEITSCSTSPQPITRKPFYANQEEIIKQFEMREERQKNQRVETLGKKGCHLSGEQLNRGADGPHGSKPSCASPALPGSPVGGMTE
ncbi:hypothetical protein AAFF_G00346980 [Aldrovandia affinis]|uniref:Ig-like domain-containing protein n=1 Tax=Aldrovandia affinis TaxID=143900 RepID=A0AAD7WP38_9TELE|nr:hypothetical protein AAFF_G00346980 [Aldrovandia affinis]